ncbi:MAG: ATP-binding protein [bacterium]|nr:ATP-binding protein [bacterium]
MIIDFSVANFRSIKTEQIFSMLVLGSKKEHPGNIFPLENENKFSLLKTGLVYGANASGKSNLLTALNALRAFVVNSTDLKLGETIPFYLPYKLDKCFRNIPTTFDMEFVCTDGIRYRYIVSFTKKEVTMEELLFYPNKQEARLFYREKGKAIKFGHHVKGRKKSIEQALLSNNLFLSKAANSNHEQFKEIYLYFRDNLVFYPTEGPPGIGFDTLRTLNMQTKEGGSDFDNRLTNLLLAADTGIHSVGVREAENGIDIAQEIWKQMPQSKMGNLSQMALKVRPLSYHKIFEGEREGETIAFDLFNDESEGTIKMYSLGGYIIPALENGHTLFIDELDRSMHPHLCEYVVKLFNNPKTNPHNAQLIVTTHDATLLNPDILRRDQIWFVSKKQGATHLFSLDQFDKSDLKRKARKNTPFEKWYLDGRLGAIPNIKNNLFRIDNGKA